MREKKCRVCNGTIQFHPDTKDMTVVQCSSCKQKFKLFSMVSPHPLQLKPLTEDNKEY